jgi:hypothetical protein
MRAGCRHFGRPFYAGALAAVAFGAVAVVRLRKDKTLLVRLRI